MYIYICMKSLRQIGRKYYASLCTNTLIHLQSHVRLKIIEKWELNSKNRNGSAWVSLAFLSLSICNVCWVWFHYKIVFIYMPYRFLIAKQSQSIRHRKYNKCVGLRERVCEKNGEISQARLHCCSYKKFEMERNKRKIFVMVNIIWNHSTN